METLIILLSDFVILRDNGIEVYLMLHSPLCLEVFGVMLAWLFNSGKSYCNFKVWFSISVHVK